MSRILRRPMFRGGRVDSRGTGITTGLMDGGRVGLFRGGALSYNPNNQSQTNTLTQAYTPKGVPQSFLNFFQGNVANRNNNNRFSIPINKEGLAAIEDYPIVKPGSNLNTELFASNPDVATDANNMPEEDTSLFSTSMEDEIVQTPEGDVELGMSTDTIENLTKKKPLEIKTPKVNEPDTEVTMTDLERALGLDDAKKEYVGDALAAASKAFFEGKGMGAISDAAAVKSKAPDIKRLAGLEQFKADRAQKLYETKLKAAAEQKAGTKGNLQKDIEYLGTLSGADRIAALGKLGYKAPSLSAAIKSMKMEGQSPDPSTIESLAALYIGPDFKGVISGDDKPTKNGKYITADGTTILIIEEGVSRIQKL